MKKKDNLNDEIRYIGFCILVILGAVIMPSMVANWLMKIKINEDIASILGSLLYIMCVFSIYRTSLVEEFKTFKSNFKSSIKTGFKYYLLGFMAMVFFNLLIVLTSKGISDNETGVREMLFDSPLISLFTIGIIGPISEELAFRKSIEAACKNKYVFFILSGLLFGGAHLLINILSGTLVLSDLLYILPYGSLGVAFAYMNYETKSTYTSMCMHMFHNLATCALLLVTYFSGVI